MPEYDIPTERAIREIAEPHLRKLNLGRHFESYTANWHGQDARDLMDLIDELCNIIDHRCPAMIDEIRARRREQAGFPPGRGLLIAKNRERLINKGGYGTLVKPVCDILREATRPGHVCSWNPKGCEELYHLINQLIERAICLVPSMLATAERMSLEKMNRLMDLAMDGPSRDENGKDRKSNRPDGNEENGFTI